MGADFRRGPILLRLPFLMLMTATVIACNADRDVRSYSFDLPSRFDRSGFANATIVTEADLIAALAVEQSARAPIRYYRHANFAKPQATAAQYLKDGLVIRNNPPLLPAPPIDWASNPNNDRNWLFRKNATSVVAPFIDAHRRTGDRAYLAPVKAVLLDWVAFNLERGEDNLLKWNDMATGLRAVNLAYLVDAELRQPAPDVTALSRLVRAAIAHADELARRELLSNSNHAYFQLTGLMAICHTIPRIARCPDYVTYAVSEMENTIERQFTAEGIHREHSPDYHSYSLTRLTRILATDWFDLSDDAARRLRLAADHKPWFRHPNGHMAMIGDTARGRAVPELFSRAMAKGSIGTEPGRVFDASGYAVLRSPIREQPFEKHSYLIFWAGDERPGNPFEHSYSHSHADDFTFEWSVNGVPVVVDSGKYSYEADEWRAYFVSTRAHNTIEIDGRDVSNRKPGNDNQWQQGPRIVSASTGSPLQHVAARTVRRKPGVSHQRLLVTQPGAWLAIVDRLAGAEPFDATQWLHFHESWTFRRDADRWLGKHPDGRLLVQTLAPDAAVADRFRGATSPRIQGWISPSYLERTPNTAIGASSEGSDLTFATLLIWDPDPANTLDDPELRLDPASTRICWSRRGQRQGFVFDADSAEPRPCDGNAVSSERSSRKGFASRTGL